ncbi:MAG: hypothetical protein ILP19_07215 [Oscillospiraceae bacterium]|nr:hypothetical protein [Oscillospiraceae bacterium]
MRIWKIIRTVCIVLLAGFAAVLVCDAVWRMGFDYPMPMMGVDAMDWLDAFAVDMAFIGIIALLPAAAVTVLLIVSVIQIRKGEKQ